MLNFSEIIYRFLIALFIGALIGLERESIGKKAGIRTMMLVTGGSALYAMISYIMPWYAYNLHGDTGVRATDMSRVISNIVVGIGFLGAGVIIKTESNIKGLTTSATIFISSAVGVLIGIGLLKIGIITGLLIVFLLFLLRKVNLNETINKKDKT